MFGDALDCCQHSSLQSVAAVVLHNVVASVVVVCMVMVKAAATAASATAMVCHSGDGVSSHTVYTTILLINLVVV
jgi:hypothetical protein